MNRLLESSRSVLWRVVCPPAAAARTGPGEGREPIPVTVAPVATIDTAERLEAGGVVAARESASISSRIVATIGGIRVKAGDRVRAGDVLITLDARDVTEHTGQARASAVAAEKRWRKPERSRARPRPNIDWPRHGRSASRRCTHGIRPRIRNVTRPRPVSPRRRRGSRALRRASKAPRRTLHRRGPPSASPRRPNPSRPCGHRSTAGDRAPHRSRQSGGTRRPTSQDRV